MQTSKEQIEIEDIKNLVNSFGFQTENKSYPLSITATKTHMNKYHWYAMLMEIIHNHYPKHYITILEDSHSNPTLLIAP